MNSNEEQLLATWFAAYVDRFAGKDGKLSPMLALKLEHSRRVSEDAAGIGQELGFGEEDVCAARMLGLFHDIGRFSQFADHQTLRDEQSFNHGHRGAEVLEDCAPLTACGKNDRGRIIAGVRHHNGKNLPDGLDSDAMQFVKIARDADKLDIFFVLYRSWKNGDLLRSPDIALMLRLDGPVNPLVLDELRRRQSVSMAGVKSLADFFLLQLSWVYRLNFRPSYQRLIRRSVLERLAEALPRTPEIEREVLLARQYADKRLTPADS